MSDHPAEPSIKDYRAKYDTFTRIPEKGRPRDEILAQMREMTALEHDRWAGGWASGGVYNGDQEHIDFLNEVYAINSQTNPLHTDLWPSAVKFESEIVAMTANMLNASATGHEPGTEQGVAGTLSSGGSESIQLAMKTYRDYYKVTKGITEPEMIAPITAHAAFDKSAQYFGIKMVHTPMRPDGRADVDAVRAAVTPNTVVIIGSAPPFPYGIVDPIEELSEIARANDIGFHTDACLGGFVLPWAEKLGYDIPVFDFRLPGVTSMSCDTHKFGYSSKGTSVVLYRNQTLRHYQYFTLTDWPGGLYCSPTFAGSRPGGLSAAAWATLVSIGESGYLEITKKICETTTEIREGMRKEFPEFELFDDSVFIVAFRSASDDLNVYLVNDAMTQRGWALNGLHMPAALHLCITQRQTQPGVADRFLSDLRESVEQVRANPDDTGRMAPIYGMANSLPDRGAIADGMLSVMDGWYRIT